MTDWQALALPATRHVPGQATTADATVLERACRTALPQTLDDTARHNTAWRYGLRLFNDGFYWETHEVLEAVWMNARPNSCERHLLQGVIHLANAALKHHMHRPQAVQRLLALAGECIARAYPQESQMLMGVARADLHRTVTAVAIGDGRAVIPAHFE